MYYILIGCDIFMGVLFVLRLNSFPPQIPLFFSRAKGEDQIADSWMIVILPLVMNILFFVNNTIYQKYFFGNGFVRKIFDYLNIFICIAITFVFLKIILLVT